MNRTDYYRRRLDIRKQSGLCYTCPSKARPGTTRCERCRQKRSKRESERSAVLVASGITHPNNLLRADQKRMVMDHYGPGCRNCGETELAFLTIDHIDGSGNRDRKLNKNNAGKTLYKKLINTDFPLGYQCLCWNCNYKKSHVAASNQTRFQRAYAKLRCETIAAYGEKCDCCGTNDKAVLTIDHVNGNGAAHRRELHNDKAKRPGGGGKLYRWLRDNSYPVGLRTLCFNCNSGRSVNGGICPHVGKEKMKEDR